MQDMNIFQDFDDTLSFKKFFVLVLFANLIPQESILFHFDSFQLFVSVKTHR